MPTDKELYTRKLNELAARYGRMEDQTTRAILRMLRETRAQINDQILQAGGTPASQFQLQALQANINRLIADFELRADAEVRRATADAYRFGGLSAVEPLQELGFSQAFYSPSKAQINILQGFSTDLIQGLTGDLRRQVDRQVRMAALGQISPFEAMKGVQTAFGETVAKQGKMVVSGVSAKAEMDVRTELQRTFNLSSQSQMDDTATRIPGLLKRWIATGDARTRRGHLEAHKRYKDNPIPIDEKFEVKDWRYTKKGGWKHKGTAYLMYPGDPSAPPEYTINCRCSPATIIPEVGVIGSSLDGRISQMMTRAEAQ